ncbi:MAG: NAD(P)H-dependent glycerol-3-phosphate dehydrogenase [Verrucomicrobiota bacterium]|nr:NAD(P)H-dependent glycerol-3-phosphate dehydrogenase [Verrucomicrobiota bacterium]
MNVTILGAGGWGTALGLVLEDGKHQVTLWGHRRELLDEIASEAENRKYLPGVSLPKTWVLQPDLKQAIADKEMLVVAVPSKAIRQVGEQLGSFRGTIVSVTKGIENESGLTMCALLESLLPNVRVAALTGPTLAPEVARRIPSAIVAAATDSEIVEQVQALFHRPYFRVYAGKDRLGVELGGALKNVIAIGAGVCDGLGFGDNSKAALITRAIAEMRRIGVACGAQPETFSGLSGLGDLTVTCFSKLSRNRHFGERVGKGEAVDAIVSSTNTIAEGYPTARSAYHLAEKLGVDAPIIREVYEMLYHGKNVRQALADLVTRSSKYED